MKKLIGLLTMIFLVGCQKFEMISEPSVAGKWLFYDYDIIIISAPSDVTINENDTICINNFGVQSLIGNKILLKQNYGYTVEDRRFIRGKTTWDFDGPSQSTFFHLLINNNKSSDVWANFKIPYFEKEYTSLEILNNTLGSVTNYTFESSGVAQNNSKKLTLLSPLISTDILVGQNKREKAVNVQILLRFMRN